MNSDEYYKHYLEETMGKKSSLGSRILIVLFIGAAIGGGVYYWKNSTDITLKKTKEHSVRHSAIVKPTVQKEVSQIKAPEITKNNDKTTPKIIVLEKNISSEVRQKITKKSKEKSKEDYFIKSKLKAAQKDIDTLEAALLSGIVKSKIDAQEHKKIDTFNKVLVSMTATENNDTKSSDKLIAISKKDFSQTDTHYVGALKVEAKTRDEEMQYVVVKKGDTLFAIAKRIYGDAMKYPTIYEANPDILNDPARIFVGQKLRVPKLLKERT